MSSALSSQPDRLYTVEEFLTLPADGVLRELVLGRIIEMPPPKPIHGVTCCAIGAILRAYARSTEAGRVLTNDAGVITHRNPDSLRGADVAFYSYARLPKGELADAYPELAPELIIEVLSPDDRWIKVLRKVTEYLEAGVIVVAVADPDSRCLHVYMADRAARILTDSDSFSCPDVLGDFQCRVGEFFDD